MLTFLKSNQDFGYMLMYIIAYIMALFIAMPFHEFAHALAAKREGDYTAVALKRYTLAPLSHIDIKGLIFLMFFGFGWAKPVPIDSRNFKRGKKSKFLVSIAGILTNLILGTLFLFIFYLILRISPEFYSSSFYGELVYTFLDVSVLLNYSLAFFNILPLYPLDGYKIVETFAKWNSNIVDFLKKYSIVIYIILVVSGIYSYYFWFTAGSIITGLGNLFTKILF